MTTLLFLICAQYRISLFAPSTHLLALDVIPIAISYAESDVYWTVHHCDD